MVWRWMRINLVCWMALPMFALAQEPKTFVRFPNSEHATLVRDGLYDHVWPFLAALPEE